MSKLPEIRFEGFDGEWEEKRLSDYLEVSKKKNKDNKYNKNDVLSVSGDYGIVNQIEFQGRSFAGESVANYGVVEMGDIVYTKSPLKANPYGIIKANKGKPGIVSTLYAVYKPKIVNSEFVQIYFEQDARMNNYMRPLVNKGAKNDMKISAENALKGGVTFPSYDEQRSISYAFDTVAALLTSHQHRLTQLQTMKKYMLQKMFPKKGEKVPEIRFEGFEGEWEEKKLGEHTQIITGGTPSTKHPEYWEPKEIPWMSSGEINKKQLTDTDNMISIQGFENSSAKWVSEKSILIALAGQGKTRGTVAINEIPITTNQSIAAVIPNDDLYYKFVFQNLEGRYTELRNVSSGDGTRGGLNKQIIADIKIKVPSYEEQQKIGDFLGSLDTLITTEQTKLDTLKTLKKYFLQKMFPHK